MERLLGILNNVETAQSVLDAVWLLKQRFRKGQIEVVHPRPEVAPDFMPTEEVWTDEKRLAFERQRDQLYEDLNDIYRGWSRENGQPAQPLQQTVGKVEHVVAQRSREADLVILGGPTSTAAEDVRAALRAALFEAEAPVIVMPQAPPISLGDYPAVAWEESEAARSAVAGMLSLLMTAKRVTVLLVREGREEPQPAVLARILEQIGVPMSIHRMELEGRTIGDALLADSKASGADLLIMGAFSHNRFLETLFGGATQQVLSEIPIPVGMHH